MPTNWKRVAEQKSLYAISDFQRAAMRLVVEQILYQSNPRQRIDYDIISTHESDFAEAIDLFGCRLDHNSQQRYVAAIPMQPDTSKIPLMHTLLALVLRKLYDHHMNRGSLNAGIAGINLSELEIAFNESTGRELPMKPQSELIGLLDAMRRWGIARPVKAENLGDAMWYVEILPGIQSLINERSLAMLKAHAEALYEPSTKTDDKSEEDKL
jgi:hypothetical protein